MDVLTLISCYYWEKAKYVHTGVEQQTSSYFRDTGNMTQNYLKSENSAGPDRNGHAKTSMEVQQPQTSLWSPFPKAGAGTAISSGCVFPARVYIYFLVGDVGPV